MGGGKIDFVKLEFDGLTTDRLIEFCKVHRLGLAGTGQAEPLTKDDFGFHLTVMYSRVNSPKFEVGETQVHPYRLRPASFDVFGPNGDILVLKMHRDKELLDLFEHYRTTYGHVSDFPDYAPHVSIRGSDEGQRARFREIPLPDFDLFADRLVHKLKDA